MKSRVKVIAPTIVAILLSIIGCSAEQATTGGIIKLNNDYPVGQVAPDIPFTSPEGKETTFGNVRQPIAILVFTNVSDETHPAVRDLARRFKYLPVTVAQIYLRTAGQSSGECPRFDNEGIVTLYDAEGIAWKAYRRPNPNTILLINEDNTIVAVSEDFGNLKQLVAKAEDMGMAVDAANADWSHP
jgi:hypothetical protein